MNNEDLIEIRDKVREKKEVRIRSRIKDFSRIEEKKLIRYLDMKVGIGVNEAYNKYLESLNREQEYYINQASGRYEIIIRVQEYKYKNKNKKEVKI